MCTYLDQVGATYYFRRVVPAELRPFIRTKTGAPRTEWKLSLGTKDRDVAKRKIPDFTIETQREIDAATAKIANTHRGRAQIPPETPVQRNSGAMPDQGRIPA